MKNIPVHLLATTIAIVLTVVSLTGCSPASPTNDSTPENPPISSRLGFGPKALTCAEGSKGTETDLANLADGPLAGEQSMGRVNSSILYQSVSSVPKAEDVNLELPAGYADWKFRKSPLIVAAGAGPITISVPDDGRQFLVWVPTSDWTSGVPQRVANWAQTSITVEPCAEHPVSFLGGVVAETSDACFAISFEEAELSEETRTVSLQENQCQ